MSDPAMPDPLTSATPVTVSAPHFTENIFAILSETFRKTIGIYLDKGADFASTLSGLSAEDASRSVLGTTIAAQVYHTAYYVQAMDRYFEGFDGKTDWDESWTVKTVDPEEWDALRTKLQSDYEQAVRKLQTVTDWGEDALDYAMMVAIHSAYHLGSVRQLVKAVEEEK